MRLKNLITKLEPALIRLLKNLINNRSIDPSYGIIMDNNHKISKMPILFVIFHLSNCFLDNFIIFEH